MLISSTLFVILPIYVDLNNLFVLPYAIKVFERPRSVLERRTTTEDPNPDNRKRYHSKTIAHKSGR